MLIALSAFVGICGAGPARASHFRVQTPGADIEVYVQFFDKVRGEPPRFFSASKQGISCISIEDRECKPTSEKFVGAYAIVRFEVHSQIQRLRERVRVIDQEDHLPERPPFEKALALIDGVGSDIELFGYQTRSVKSDLDASWRFFRQELFLGDEQTPFLILHWKHTVDAITLIDVIPSNPSSRLEK